MENQIDFQLRHRESYHKEKMAELEEKYSQEIEQERTKYELLREEKNEMELEYIENMKDIEEVHAFSACRRMLCNVQQLRPAASRSAFFYGYPLTMRQLMA